MIAVCYVCVCVCVCVFTKTLSSSFIAWSPSSNFSLSLSPSCNINSAFIILYSIIYICMLSTWKNMLLRLVKMTNGMCAWFSSVCAVELQYFYQSVRKMQWCSVLLTDLLFPPSMPFSAAKYIRIGWKATKSLDVYCFFLWHGLPQCVFFLHYHHPLILQQWGGRSNRVFRNH